MVPRVKWAYKDSGNGNGSMEVLRGKCTIESIYLQQR